MAMKFPSPMGGVARTTLANLTNSLDDFQRSEVERCRSDIAYFIDTYGIIDDSQGIGIDDGSGTTPFKLWDDQRQVLKDIEENRRIIILKSRQLGISWTVIGYIWGLSKWNNGQIALLLSLTEEDAKELIRRIAVLESRLPEWLRKTSPLAKTPNASSIVYANGSRIMSRAATPTAGSGQAATIVLMDEAAKMPWARPLFTAIKPTVEAGRAKLILLSTAYGTGNLFHDVWTMAMEGVNGFKWVFLPWWSRPGRDAAWYSERLSEAVDPNEVKQEHPSCVIAETRASSRDGIFVFGDHSEYNKGMAPILRMKTRLGYEITATPNHHFWLPGDQWKALEDLEIGESVRLLPPVFGSHVQEVPVKLGLPILDHDIKIDEDFAEFLGVFMGDGCISKEKTGSQWILSVVFDAKDMDAVERMKDRMARLFGGVTERTTGKTAGCVELRTSSKYLGELFESLGLFTRQRTSGRVRRKIHVPKYILKSPRPVVAAFLRGLFDSDGFIGYQRPTVKFFSKHVQFIKDVQLLLLGFGITSKFNTVKKVNGEGRVYSGNELVLRKNETVSFMREIGFLSNRKNQRWADQIDNIGPHVNDLPLNLSDSVASIEPAGVAHVYDMEVVPEHYYSANGFWVHNSPIEAFLVSGRMRFPAEWIADQAKNLVRMTPSDGLSIYQGTAYQQKYILAADVAEGVEHGDFSTAVVIDRATRTEHACLHGHWEPGEFARRLDELGRKYDADLIVERNNHGHAVLLKLKDLKYPRIADGHDGKPGWLTNGQTKPQAIDLLAEGLRDNTLSIRSESTLNELQIYSVLDNGKTSAPSGKHDDRVMSWAIAVAWLRLCGQVRGMSAGRTPGLGYRG